MPCGGKFDSAKIESRLTQATALDWPSAPRARIAGREFLRQPQQAEIIHVHLGARGLDAVARGDAEVAMMVGGVDEDVDASADFAGEVLHGARIGQIERHQRDLRDRRDRRSKPGGFFHGSA